MADDDCDDDDSCDDDKTFIFFLSLMSDNCDKGNDVDSVSFVCIWQVDHRKSDCDHSDLFFSLSQMIMMVMVMIMIFVFDY